MNSKVEIAIFGGGCFWCTEAIFSRVKGVVSVTSGYAGGTTVNPTYDDVSSGATGHAEVIRIEFDPNIITYMELLDIFWHVHDPTSLNQQGADIGTEYKSIILTTSSQQLEQATESMKKLDDSHEYKNRIVTRILPLEKFYTAEQYHAHYFENHATQPYCELVIAPKIKKFLEKYADKAVVTSAQQP